MKATIQKWGNSLALRIPRTMAEDLGLAQHSLVELTMARGALVLKPAKRVRPALAALLDKVTTENIHAEADLGPPQGRESW
ncbi:MAG: AbrB/MazE/SpoVT family DNA-binding domain-containing protein [Rhodospirillaceae bacterium]|jgi:antitoxin MazE